MGKVHISRAEKQKYYFYIAGVFFAISSFFIAILWFRNKPFWFLNANNLEQATYILGSISACCFAVGNYHIWLFPQEPASDIHFTEIQLLRHRQAMLSLVRNTWIEGYLKNSLQKEVSIRLGLKEKKDAVKRPFDLLLKTVGQPDKPISTRVKLSTIFKKMNQSLLILGDPGSGKTILLLELTRELLLQAEKDTTRPIPVVFNLSSWIDEKQTLMDWLINELREKYRIPSKIAADWVKKDQLTLLLDGLDEVAADRREKCVAAINAFCQEHLAPVAVCSRITDYDALRLQLNLQNAVQLQPLSKRQIIDYLTKLGSETETLQLTLKKDEQLQEIAKAPLMLNIITIAYQGETIEEEATHEAMVNRYKHIFNAYIRRMLVHRRSENQYPSVKLLESLNWLAMKLVKNSDTIFQIENIQPNWLQSPNQLLAFHIIGGLCNRQPKLIQFRQYKLIHCKS